MLAAGFYIKKSEKGYEIRKKWSNESLISYGIECTHRLTEAAFTWNTSSKGYHAIGTNPNPFLISIIEKKPKLTMTATPQTKQAI